MALDHAWLGTGLGTYYLAWPRYRDPADSTLGFFAHNDYLHLWIEAGAPGLLLLLAILAVALTLFVQLLRARPQPGIRIEASALLCGLLAVAVHSILDFNLYILATSILAGLALGRFQELAADALHKPPREFRSHALFGLRSYRLIVSFATVLPIAYLVALGLSDHFFKRAFMLAAQGKLGEAGEAFEWSEQLAASDDKTYLAHADLYRHAIAGLPPDAERHRRALYEGALLLLDEAQAKNPYRAMIPAVRGRLYHERRAFAGPRWRHLVEAEFLRALVLDPRLYQTRMSYTRLLLEAGERETARRVLEQGLDYWYFPEPALLSFYELAAHLRRETGDESGAMALVARIAETRAAMSLVAPARPVVPELALPTARSS